MTSSYTAFSNRVVWSYLDIWVKYEDIWHISRQSSMVVVIFVNIKRVMGSQAGPAPSVGSTSRGSGRRAGNELVGRRMVSEVRPVRPLYWADVDDFLSGLTTNTFPLSKRRMTDYEKRSLATTLEIRLIIPRGQKMWNCSMHSCDLQIRIRQSHYQNP